ncbi:hypothetical protein [Streptoalloteichus hindustanus]|uniref:Secreted protein n=1 Tax=Streptoalloteichus hindustanus TaxID=2017 RepID=A0A1M5B431_STRHI|nr:hypothetical protein [Streptoalloteichus hindustanus]SHF37190.1 hypothetical protein SAMN05444320_103388 [Streptoalloteichus hindustanus]
MRPWTKRTFHAAVLAAGVAAMTTAMATTQASAKPDPDGHHSAPHPASATAAQPAAPAKATTPSKAPIGDAKKPEAKKPDAQKPAAQKPEATKADGKKPGGGAGARPQGHAQKDHDALSTANAVSTTPEEVRVELPLDTCHGPYEQAPSSKRVPCADTTLHATLPNAPVQAGMAAADTMETTLDKASKHLAQELRKRPQSPATTLSGTGHALRGTATGIAHQVQQERPLTDLRQVEAVLDVLQGRPPAASPRSAAPAEPPGRPKFGVTGALENVGVLQDANHLAKLEFAPYNRKRPQALAAGDYGVEADLVHGQTIEPFAKPLTLPTLDEVDVLEPLLRKEALQALSRPAPDLNPGSTNTLGMLMPITKNSSSSPNPFGPMMGMPVSAPPAQPTPRSAEPASAELTPRAGKLAPGTQALTNGSNPVTKLVTSALGQVPITKSVGLKPSAPKPAAKPVQDEDDDEKDTEKDTETTDAAEAVQTAAAPATGSGTTAGAPAPTGGGAAPAGAPEEKPDVATSPGRPKRKPTIDPGIPVHAFQGNTQVNDLLGQIASPITGEGGRPL